MMENTKQELETIEPQQTQPQPAAVVPHPEHGGFMPMLSIQEAQQRFNALKQFVRENLRKDVDYGSIPGASDKPTLLKPGAEKLCTFFGLRSQFEIIEHTQDWERGFFNYWYKCRLFRDDACIAEGEGSANSYERKYRWRTVSAYKASDEERARAVREETRRSRDGRSYRVLLLENDDPYTLVNTLQKMAQKRALIAATLIAVNASEFFTQDIEDMVLDTDVEPEAETPEAPRQSYRQPETEPAETRGGQGGQGGESAEQPQLPLGPPASEAEEVTLKFRGRPSQEILTTIKSAGFRWDPKQVMWHAPATAERMSVAEELEKRGVLQS